jgi:hypothetical protein
MADTYTWGIVTLDREISDGVVNTVHWTLNATRSVSGETYTAGSYGAQSFTANPSDPGFIPYDSLTEAICIGWVKDALTSGVVTQMESGLTSSLDEKENPTESEGVPWSTFDS